MVQYSNWILDIADECDLNDITQQEIMAMVFITHCRSPQFRKELRRHGVGVTWQFILKEAQGWDRSQRCEEQSNEKAYAVKRNAGNAQNRNQRPSNTSSYKKEKAEAFFRRRMVANLIEEGESSGDEAQESALAVFRRVSNASPVYRC